MPLHLPSHGAPTRVLRSSRVRRRAAAVLTVCAVAVTVSTGGRGSATADPPTQPGAATSKAAEAVAGAGLTIAANAVSVLPGTAVSALLATLGVTGSSVSSGLVSNIVTPLSTVLTRLPSSVLTSLADSITGAGLRADSPSSQQPRPTDGSYPTCGQQGWTTGSGGDCYTGLPALGSASLVAVSTGTAQGYATSDDQGYLAAAHVADPALSVLGIGLGDLGVVDSTASCAQTTASCTATQTLTGSKSLLGGHLTLSLANGSFLAQVDGVTVPDKGSTITLAPGLTATVNADGNLATIAISLSTTQLLTALGVPTLLSALGTTLGTLTDTSGPSAATLTVKIGPGSLSQGSPAYAWGLNVSVDLAVDMKLSVKLGSLIVATVEVATVPTASANLATLKLGYSTATAGLLLPGWLAPSLI